MALTKLIDFESVERLLRQILNAVTYSRTSTDAMRVNVDNAPQANIFTGNNGSAPLQGGILNVTPFSSSSWNIMDAREPQRELSEQHFAITRQRWTIT